MRFCRSDQNAPTSKHGDNTHNQMGGVTLCVFVGCVASDEIFVATCARQYPSDATSDHVGSRAKHTQFYGRRHTVRFCRTSVHHFFVPCTMFDIDIFIQCVQDKPALWKKSVKEYADKNAREKSWHEIGEVMHEKWLDLEPAEREKKGKINDLYSVYLSV